MSVVKTEQAEIFLSVWLSESPPFSPCFGEYLFLASSPGSNIHSFMSLLYSLCASLVCMVAWCVHGYSCDYLTWFICPSNARWHQSREKRGRVTRPCFWSMWLLKFSVSPLRFFLIKLWASVWEPILPEGRAADGNHKCWLLTERLLF